MLQPLFDRDLMVPSSSGQTDLCITEMPPRNTSAFCRSLVSSGGEHHKKFDGKHLAVCIGVPAVGRAEGCNLQNPASPSLGSCRRNCAADSAAEPRGTLSLTLRGSSRSCDDASGCCP